LFAVEVAMQQLPPIHLCVIQPPGYVHSLGLLDQARYYRWQFRRLGATVSIAKNRLQHDAVNFVFGAHLGFDTALRQRYSIVFVNLEQLGAGGASVSADYLTLLGGSAVVDSDGANLAAYTQHPDDVPIAPLLHAPYLAPASGAASALEDRPIDLLFVGTLNERRRRMIAAIEAQGVSVSLFDAPLYGPERDRFIRQAKAVFNCHNAPSRRFEQGRIAHCLSLGTPVVSERSVLTQSNLAFEDAVFWVDEQQLGPFFAEAFATPEFFAAARRKLAAFTTVDDPNAYAEVLSFATGYRQAHRKQIDHGPWRPTRVNLGCGKDYRMGWLNLDVQAAAQPDVLLDLGQPQALPIHAEGALGGAVVLEAESVDSIHANGVLEHVPDLPQLMTNCLALLKAGGDLVVEVPYENARTAWQDPTQVRALNENSWIYYTDWFWYLGWFEHRFALAQFEYLDENLKVCGVEQAEHMRAVLRKVVTTPQERNVARVMRADFCLDDDAAPVPMTEGRVNEDALAQALARSRHPQDAAA
jgi:hypothetical protein